jgi:hypothetical protein
MKVTALAGLISRNELASGFRRKLGASAVGLILKLGFDAPLRLPNTATNAVLKVC